MRVDELRNALVSLAMVALAGCASGGGTSGTAPAVVVNDVASLAGKWTGILEVEGSRDRDDLLELTVDPSGTYRASAARTIGALDSQGKIALVDGKVRLEGARGGRATGTLYGASTSPDRSLLVDGVLPSGRRFTVRLRPAGAS
jgi:hypothetical protein